AVWKKYGVQHCHLAGMLRRSQNLGYHHGCAERCLAVAHDGSKRWLLTTPQDTLHKGREARNTVGADISAQRPGLLQWHSIHSNQFSLITLFCCCKSSNLNSSNMIHLITFFFVTEYLFLYF
ncbi:unnamed protein product, partial [Lymnaea stagnalis]